MPELAPVEHYEKVNAVVDLYVKGHTATQISRKLGYPRKDVIQMVDDWKAVVSKDPYIKARALDTVNEAIEHYRAIKERAWDVADRAKSDDDKRSELSAMTLAGNIQKQEFELLRAAGVMQDDDIIDKVMEIEQQKEKVLSLLRELGPRLCPADRRLVAEELSKLSDKAEVIHVD